MIITWLEHFPLYKQQRGSFKSVLLLNEVKINNNLAIIKFIPRNSIFYQ